MEFFENRNWLIGYVVVFGYEGSRSFTLLLFLIFMQRNNLPYRWI